MKQLDQPQELAEVGVPVFLLGATGTGKSAAAMELARAGRAARGDPGHGRDAGLSRGGYRDEQADGGGTRGDSAWRAGPGGFRRERSMWRSICEHAAAFLREQREAGRRVIVVGGTGLYFRALTRGLCEAPQGPEDLRAELAALSVEELRARLEKVDPAMLERLDAANPRRLARAIEVMESTGQVAARMAGGDAGAAGAGFHGVLDSAGEGGAGRADRGAGGGDVCGGVGGGGAGVGRQRHGDRKRCEAFAGHRLSGNRGGA